ncbi:MAG: isochorismate synthase [Chromatiaceae bacterium]
MLAPLDILDQLKARLRETVVSAVALDGEGFLSLILAIPPLPGIAPQLTGPQFHFIHAHRNEMRAGYGSAGEWLATGPGRLQSLRAEAKRLAACWQQLDLDETGFTGFAMLGFAARSADTRARTRSRFPNALLWLPEVALHTRSGQGAIVLTTAVPSTGEEVLARWTGRLEQLLPFLGQPMAGPLRPAPLERRSEQPDAQGWQLLVRSALTRIARKDLQKVVIGRRLRLEGSRSFDLSRLMAALTFLFPSCQVINLRRGEVSFVAATPERLLTQRGNRVEVDALAGTAARAPNTAWDAALTEALRSSGKNLHEHRLVVEAVRNALAQCSTRFEAPHQPQVMLLNNAQHLWSPIKAELVPGTDVFALAELLHPTPATNGEPRDEAIAWLRQVDPFERGWYTGAAGVVEPDLTGELWVLLRCAEVVDHRADLYAGAGIVAGSDPSVEWRETEDKLSAMLMALQFA